MPSRRDVRKIQEEGAQLAAEDPLIVNTHSILSKWSERVAVSGRTLLQVQQLIGVLAAQLDTCKAELADIYVDANLLSALRLSEYRRKTNPVPTPSVPSKRRKSGKRESNSKIVSKPVEENSTEALITGMDEKKRLKISTALAGFFKRPSEIAVPVTSVSPTQQLPSGKTPPSSPPVQLNEGTGRQFALSIVSDSMSVSTSADRRPKDIPSDLWNEMARLRFRRLALDGRMEVLTNDLTAQIKLFDMLAQNYGIASYSKDSAERTLQSLKRSKGIV